MFSGIEGNRPSEMNSRPKLKFCSDLTLTSNADGPMIVEQTLEVDFSVEKMYTDLYRKVISDYIENTVNERPFSNLVLLTILNHDIKKFPVRIDGQTS